MLYAEGEPGVGFPMSLYLAYPDGMGGGLYCPISLTNGNPDGLVMGGTHYVPSGGSFTPWWNPSPTGNKPGDNTLISSTATANGWTNQQAIDYYKRHNGVYAGYPNGISIAQVTDGTSNTIAFMEQHGGFVQPGLGLWWDGYYFQAWASGVLWINFGVCPDPNNQNCWQIDTSYNPTVFSQGPPNFGMGPWVQTPGSLHVNNVMNVAMVDGSVQRLANLASLYNSGLLLSLVGCRDGDTATLP
jgi:prepilin-type processing-associated H-X9-DG protein